MGGADARVDAAREGFAAATVARLAWSGWVRVTARRRAIDARAIELYDDRTKRLTARALVAWSRATKFQNKRRELLGERCAEKLKSAAMGRTLWAWKTTVREQRNARRDVIRNYLLWRAKRFLRAWRDVAMEGAKDRPKKPRVEKSASEQSTATATALSPTPTRAPRQRISVTDMKQRLWTKADASTKPMPTVPQEFIEEIQEIEAKRLAAQAAEESVEAERVDTVATHEESSEEPASTSTTTTTKQHVKIQRRKVTVRRAEDGSTPEEVPVPALRDVATMTTTEKEITTSAASADNVSSTSNSSSHSSFFSILILVVAALAVVGAVALASVVTGFSVMSPMEGSVATQMVRKHLSEAQKNVTLLARASAMQRRELEACRTFGGGVPDASQNAAIASAQAKVSDSMHKVADLEAQLSQYQADVAAARSAQKLAEDRFKRLGEGAMKTAILQESLQKAQTRAAYCESTSSRALKIQAMKDAAESRAETAERELTSKTDELTKTQAQLTSAQRALTKTVEVANECRRSVGKAPYEPTYYTTRSFIRLIVDVFPALAWFFSKTAMVFYFVCGYAYYLRVMVRELVGERDTLVSELAKLRVGGADVVEAARLHHLDRTEKLGDEDSTLIIDDEGATAASLNIDRKRSRSVDDVVEQVETTQKKTATMLDVVTESKLEVDEEKVKKSGAATPGSDSGERRDRAHNLMENWVAKSQDDEISDELARIRRLVEVENERERREEEERLEQLKRRIRAQDNS
ncbi:hypothetical protein BE221DRAFT_170643 [Ostreococcus tauri]|uniref:Uncharacterized protein n=1 Tax=Ostreococcus tauri TaxID=70448 RepID=A0A1Y5IDH9_OSTTA|nr:hypothetical protein BE221DRAFT_170643 [Ostreococcus tauri]